MKNLHLGLIRAYAMIIILVNLTGALEGAAFTLLIVMAALAILIQSFLLPKVK